MSDLDGLLKESIYSSRKNFINQNRNHQLQYIFANEKQVFKADIIKFIAVLEATNSLNAISAFFGFLKHFSSRKLWRCLKKWKSWKDQVNMVDGLKLHSLMCAASDE